MSLEAGQIIDNKYRVVRVIGEGGMGAVFEGENVRIKRRVAIKTLHAAIANNADVVMRFEREAQAAGRIGSDHILDVLDIGALENGDRFIVMEFLDGEPLSKRISQLGRMSPAQLLPLIHQVLEGLGAAHAASIIHRDLKPDNIFILRQKAGRKDYVKIIDFGISKFSSDAQSIGMTRTGTMMGTPLYMSPEQANGSSEADARSDIYAIGMIMYEALSGSTPFTAKTFNELLFQIVLFDIPPLDRLVPGLDPGLAAIVGRAMSRDRTHRYASTTELAGALETWAVQAGALPAPSFAATISLPASASHGTPSQPGVIGSSQPGVGHPDPIIAQTPWPASQQSPPSNPPQPTTQGSWGHGSQPGVAPPPREKSKAPRVAAIAFGALALFGAGGFALSRIMGANGKAPDQVKTAAPEAKEATPPKAAEAEVKAKASSDGAKPAESAAPSVSASSALEPAATKPAQPKQVAAPSAPPKGPSTGALPKGPSTNAPPVKTGPSSKKPADWGY